MAKYPGFIGGTATVRSRNANAERATNWYPEQVPGTGKVRAYAVPAPGLELFTVLGDGPVRALFAQDGRAFAVGGTGFYELFANRTSVWRGLVPQNANPATISSNGSNGQQLLITSGGENYLYSLTANTLTLLGASGPPTPTRMSCFSDGYFIALKANSNQFNISGLSDGASWDPLDFFAVSTVADQLVALKESHRDLWLFGSQTTSVWANTGDADTPFAPIPGVKIDQGCGAAFSVVGFDNSLMWLGESEAGSRVIWRADGYTPRRVSTHGIEYVLNLAARVDDAIAWTYQEEGHTFYGLYVPALANVREWGVTFHYDAATELWHERAIWDTVLMDWQPDLVRCHAYGFGRHLVGDRQSPAVYTQRLGLATDDVVALGLIGSGGSPQPEVPDDDEDPDDPTDPDNPDNPEDPDDPDDPDPEDPGEEEPDGLAVLTAADFAFKGYIRVPYNGDSLYYGGVGPALRRVGDEVRLLTAAMTGEPIQKKLLEFVLPETEPSLTLASAPYLTFQADHGNIWANAFANAPTTGAESFTAVNFGGIVWDPVRNGLLATYGDPYGVSLPLHPTLLFAKFTGDVLSTVYGPFRQELPPNQTRGALLAIPGWFGDAYLDGARFGITSGSNSGIATCPRGPNLVAIEDFDPTLLAPATYPNPAYDPSAAQVANHAVLMHTQAHRAARDTNWKVCGWSAPPTPQNYNCVLNKYVEAGPATWGGPINGFDVEDDSTTGSCWIQTATKHGLIVAAVLVTAIPGYTPPGGDTLPHTWYGDPDHATNNGTAGAGYEDGKCCHGQDDPYWGATGPGAHLRVPHWLIYDPADLVAPATGAADLWTPTPTETIQWTDGAGNLSFPGLDRQQRAGWFGAPVYDPVTRRLYAFAATIDPTSVWGSGQKQPALLVWEVAE